VTYSLAIAFSDDVKTLSIQLSDLSLKRLRAQLIWTRNQKPWGPGSFTLGLAEYFCVGGQRITDDQFAQAASPGLVAGASILNAF
jgi:hypothetical protein